MKRLRRENKTQEKISSVETLNKDHFTVDQSESEYELIEKDNVIVDSQINSTPELHDGAHNKLTNQEETNILENPIEETKYLKTEKLFFFIS